MNKVCYFLETATNKLAYASLMYSVTKSSDVNAIRPTQLRVTDKSSKC
jgi:hypothetical protein